MYRVFYERYNRKHRYISMNKRDHVWKIYIVFYCNVMKLKKIAYICRGLGNVGVMYIESWKRRSDGM